jgi:hypothetical protein
MRWRDTASAVVERQMLPRQTKEIVNVMVVEPATNACGFLVRSARALEVRTRASRSGR